jgi:hypothetical protein
MTASASPDSKLYSETWTPGETDQPNYDGVTVTFFDDTSALSASRQWLALDEISDAIARANAPTKEQLGLLKLATFGDRRTDKRCLRHDGNVLRITGIEADYDAKLINGHRLSFVDGAATLKVAGILAIIYTSPSHTEDVPKWRILCPLSRDYPPSERDRFMARLNGVFQNAFAPESWTLSQSFYFGSVRHNPSHSAMVIEGSCIDLLHELDATAIAKPKTSKPNGANGQHHPAARPEDITDKRVRGLVEALLDTVRRARDGEKHHTLLRQGRTLGGYLHIIGWSADQAVQALINALPDSVEDWEAARQTAEHSVGSACQNRSTWRSGPIPGPARNLMSRSASQSNPKLPCRNLNPSSPSAPASAISPLTKLWPQ